MAGPFDNPFGLSALALPLREQRLKVLSSNIANADTPGYQARDLDFQAALKDVESQQRSIGAGASRGASGASGDAASAMGLGLADGPDVRRHISTRDALQGSLDGNTVNTETEHANFGRAVLEYRASLTFFEGRVRGLMTAITGQ